LPWPFDWFKALRSESTETTQPGAPQQRASREWDALPPIQTTTGGLETTADSLGFVRQLPGRTGPEPALQPLGHRRSLEAPRGLADLALGTVQTYAGREGMVLKRRPAPVQPLRWPEGGEAGEPSSPPEEQRLGEVLEPEAASALGATTELPPPAPPRPVVAVSLPAPVTASRLTRAPLDLAPPSPSPKGLAEPKPALEIARSPEPGPAPTQAPLADKASRLNLGQARRLGLGPPLSLPPSVQRSTTDPEEASAGPAATERPMPTVSSEPVDKASAASSDEVTTTSSANPRAERHVAPILRVQRRPVAGSAGSDLAGSPAAADFPAAADLPASTESRAVADFPAVSGASPAQPMRQPAPSRAVSAAAAQAARILPPTAQRIPAANQQALVSVQRRAVQPLDLGPSGNAETHGPFESPGASTSRLDLPLAHLAPGTPADAAREFEFGTHRPDSYWPPAVQRAPGGVVQRDLIEFHSPLAASMNQAGFKTEVQRAEEAPTPGMAPGLASSPGGGDVPLAAPVPGQSEAELDDLALRLYDRFRSHLRSELLIDRERAGLLTDLR
jgi:hypothetical protein